MDTKEEIEYKILRNEKHLEIMDEHIDHLHIFIGINRKMIKWISFFIFISFFLIFFLYLFGNKVIVHFYLFEPHIAFSITTGQLSVIVEIITLISVIIVFISQIKLSKLKEKQWKEIIKKIKSISLK